MTEQEAAMIAHYEALKRPLPPALPAAIAKPPQRPPSKKDRLIATFKRDPKEVCAFEAFLAKPDAPTMNSIIVDMAAQYGVPVHGIKSKCRVAWISNIRQEFYYRAAKETVRAYAEIGRFCGGRDHTTVMYGISQHCKRHGLEHPRNPRDEMAERKAADHRRYKANLREIHQLFGAPV